MEGIADELDVGIGNREETITIVKYSYQYFFNSRINSAII